MAATVVYIPRLPFGDRHLDPLLEIWETHGAGSYDLEVNFERCSFLEPAAVAFLGAMARSAQKRKRRVYWRWRTLTQKVRMNLRQNGFERTFKKDGEQPWDGNSIQYREDPSLDENSLVDHLRSAWMGRAWVKLSDELRDMICGQVTEIYTNAFIHSRSPVGVFSCGQHFPKDRRLELTIIDFGCGVPDNVRTYLGKENATERHRLAGECMRWAFGKGNSTLNTSSMRRGMGLHELREFVCLNGGKIAVHSESGYSTLAKDAETYTLRAPAFPGTRVTITLQSDEAFYHVCPRTNTLKRSLFNVPS